MDELKILQYPIGLNVALEDSELDSAVVRKIDSLVPIVTVSTVSDFLVQYLGPPFATALCNVGDKVKVSSSIDEDDDLLYMQRSEGLPADMDMEPAGCRVVRLQSAHSLVPPLPPQLAHFIEGMGMGDDLEAVVQTTVRLDIHMAISHAIDDFFSRFVKSSGCLNL